MTEDRSVRGDWQAIRILHPSIATFQNQCPYVPNAIDRSTGKVAASGSRSLANTYSGEAHGRQLRSFGQPLNCANSPATTKHVHPSKGSESVRLILERCKYTWHSTYRDSVYDAKRDLNVCLCAGRRDWWVLLWVGRAVGPARLSWLSPMKPVCRCLAGQHPHPDSPDQPGSCPGRCIACTVGQFHNRTRTRTSSDTSPGGTSQEPGGGSAGHDRLACKLHDDGPGAMSRPGPALVRHRYSNHIPRLYRYIRLFLCHGPRRNTIRSE